MLMRRESGKVGRFSCIPAVNFGIKGVCRFRQEIFQGGDR